ncbi:TatD family hydrolase [Flavobacterium sp. Fl-77]|uniref:TatD family hydrolase n=1 Tax=Flavobacterium flavipigmentatum TaxID=2893884 RepID=A0AAJ2W1N0_9FLAO|nr:MULTISPECIES: TatD family hydrolase [unclassified Flavobacterium]MDX6182977.1 TatD family hydrolase [Flavobacterium sp. Fl-33]MDX6186430.1 TatD family hydrolase [Flavobacterium sp. Fl-77]UFH37784.1 TatD family hydrolase [Flavobacterium sp. F-70]
MDFFNFHTHRFTNQLLILELVNQYPHEFDSTIPFYSIGIHPWYIVENRIDEDLKIIEEKLQTENCLAVGECGIDKRIEIPLEQQMKVFEKQLALAEKYQKPVVIHCVAAFQEVIAIKKKMKISVPMIVHGFSKNNQVAQQLIKEGFYISFGKYLLRNPDLKTVFQKVPIDRFFLETDTIDESIEQVYELASEYKNITIRELKDIIASNFRKVFER